MKHVRAAWVGVLCLNLTWVVILPSQSGKASAIIGAAIAALAVLLPFVSSRGHSYLHDIAGASVRIPAAALVLPFLLPAISLITTPTVAFWHLDGRAWLILGWMWCGILLALPDGPAPPATGRSPLVRSGTLLFLLWTSALWLTVVSDLGIRRVILETDRTVPMVCRSDWLTTVFSIWEGTPAREHVFLGWRSWESFQTRTPYANHVHPYLFTMYGWTRTVRALSGVAPYVATNTVPLFYVFMLLTAFTVFLARAGLLRERQGPVRLLALFVAYGLIVTTWRFWNDLYRFNSDNPFPLLVAVFLLVYAFLLAPARPVAAGVSAAVFVALSPIHTPMALVALLGLFGKAAATRRDFLHRNRAVIAISFAVVLVGVVSYLAPRILIALKGYVPVGSSYLFRSGLDGDTRYFSNMAQAVFASCPAGCCFPRQAGELIWPAFLPLVFAGAATRWRDSPGTISLGHLLLFLTTPYWMSVVLFPQSVSIHPYLYDHLLLIPVVLVGSAAMITPALQSRLHGAKLLVFLLLTGGLLMSNLIGIAQALATMPS